MVYMFNYNYIHIDGAIELENTAGSDGRHESSLHTVVRAAIPVRAARSNENGEEEGRSHDIVRVPLSLKISHECCFRKVGDCPVEPIFSYVNESD